MADGMEYEGLYRGMGDIVDDDGVGESLYHYAEAPAPQQRPQPRQRRAASANAQQSDLSDDLSDDDLSDEPVARPRAPVAAPAQSRGLKTPVILGLSAGAFAAAGVYSWMRWKRGEPEGAGQLAGVAGGASALAVTITILAARGAGLLDRGKA